MKLSSMAARARALVALTAGLAGLAAAGTAQANNELYGWRGFYVGLLGTYNVVKQDIDFTTPAAVSGSTDLDGTAVTGLVGYRIPLGNERHRIGIEADASIGDNRGNFNQYRFVSDFTVTLRAMYGIHIHPDFMWFVTGGVGWMGINSSSVAIGAGAGGGGAIADRRHSETVIGSVVGTGFEWDMSKAIHLRGEYLYGSYESHRAESAISDKTIDTQAHQVRLGLVFSLQNPYDEPHGRGGDIDRDRYTRSSEPLK